jgi:hypothetical protein
LLKSLTSTVNLVMVAQLITSNDTIAAMKKVEHHVVW